MVDHGVGDREFRRYRMMSFVTGTTLLLLFILAGLQSWVLSSAAWHHDGWSAIARVLGIGHGVVLYPIYLVTCFMLMLKARLPIVVLVSMLLAGFVPGLAFGMEYWVSGRLGYRTNKG